MATDRGLLIAADAVFAALTMALHTWIPNGAANLGSLFQTFLPWAGLSAPVLLLAAAVRRSRLAAVAVLAPVTVWGCLFGGTLTDKQSERSARSERSAGGGGNFTVASHNVDEENPDPARTARALAASGADVLALEEMSSKATPAYERELAAGYPYRSDTLGVRLWSKHPLNGVEAVPVMPWTRAVWTAALPARSIWLCVYGVNRGDSQTSGTHTRVPRIRRRPRRRAATRTRRSAARPPARRRPPRQPGRWTAPRTAAPRAAST
ncbi:endonuclease/exonuclease/phosphatase family protein [Streptomyces sp. M-16]|uniref:endonuclease/exonuclease/phosphatase family protein n=1 Tax=Streptomyces sp. M-16 TaxID=3233040 RepID=UPI003F9E14D3